MKFNSEEIRNNVLHFIREWSNISAAAKSEFYGSKVGVHYGFHGRGRKYQRIVSYDDSGVVRNVLAFVDADGGLYKPEGFNSPAEHIRYNIGDREECDKLLAHLNSTKNTRQAAMLGSYLYITYSLEYHKSRQSA